MKTNRMTTVSTLLILVLSATTAATPTDDVRCREIAFSLSAEHRDADGFVAFIDPDARFIGSSAMRGVEQIVEGWQVFFADDGPTIKWRPQFVEVLEDGTLALTRGPYQMISTDDEGNSVEQWGTFNSIWRLHDDGEWRVVFDAGSPSNEAPTDEQREILESTCEG
jgi:uncharacterized protein (TIGR02246 family)